MFTIDTSITDLKIKDRNLFKVLFSMNNHQVANPEMSLEEARSYVFFFKDGGKYQAYVALYFIPSDRRMFYSYSSPSFGDGEMADVEEEARSFAEGLGAMLDEIHFAGLSTEDRNNWIDAQEMLGPKKKEPEAAPVPVAAPVPEPAAAVQPAPVEPVPPVPSPQPVLQPAAPPVQPAGPVPAATIAVPVEPAPVPTAGRSTSQTVPGAWQPPQQSLPETPVAEELEVRADVQAQAPQRIARKLSAPVRQEITDQDGKDQTAAGVDDVLDEAVRAGVVKAPKAKLKKDIHTSTGSIGREKEALARLLSSF